MAVFLGSVGDDYDLGAGYFGNGLTIYNRKKEVKGDYKKIAHIDDFGKITYYDKNLPKSIKNHIIGVKDRMMKERSKLLRDTF
jgi:hypothetical protein